MSESIASDKVTYHGNCHCGAFKFDVTIPPLKVKAAEGEEDSSSPTTQVIQCNCSVCVKKGYLLTRIAESDFKATKGSLDETLKVYTFHRHAVLHRFCPTCGTAICGWRKDPQNGQVMFVLNVRTFQNVDLDTLDLKPFDGMNVFQPPFAPPAFTDHGLEISSDEEARGFKIYTGSCHCGKVKLAVKSQALNSGDVEIRNDDCSRCTRQGLTMIYPAPYHELVAYSGEENLQSYMFGNKIVAHRFCTTCGVQVDLAMSSAINLDVLPPAKRAIVEQKLTSRPINLRVLDDWVLLGGEKGMGIDQLIKTTRGVGADYVVPA